MRAAVPGLRLCSVPYRPPLASLGRRVAPVVPAQGTMVVQRIDGSCLDQCSTTEYLEFSG